MKILNNFIKEYHKEYSLKQTTYEKGLIGDIKKINDKLLDDKFLPSFQLNSILNKQLRRARYPMEVAIIGQFSSGKSTFLNALLSKNILPTGITPVTSKVNFINYGDEYKLKITYKSGAQEYHSIENIAKFTDQRKKDIDDIKYLTIYAPMDILKDISFVDTPGLNSQSQSDTNTTKKVLRDVGGIIWLSLIDNAGKMSEAEILEEYILQFKNKSLCVLNQKDKFTKEQVKTSQAYISEKFGKYFSQVTPISAKLALDSREKQQKILIQDKYDLLIKDFKLEVNNNMDLKNLDFFQENFTKFKKEIDIIKSKDKKEDHKLLKESNINEVLEFIENIIRPQANEAKEFSIKKDLKNICDILIKEYKTILGTYDSLIDILKNSKDEILELFDDIQIKYSKELFLIYNELENIMEKIANETYKNIQTIKATRYEEKNSFLSKDKFEQIQYDTYWINSDNIYKNLFYDDQSVDNMFKKVIKHLKEVETSSNEAYRSVYKVLKNKITRWQEPYELIRKNRDIASDLEFSATRHFAAKVYENILVNYHKAILENISALRKKFAYFNGALSYSYIQTTQATISHFEQQIKESIELYEKEPTKFTVHHPKEDEIITKLKANFSFEKIEDFLTSKRNYLYKIIKYSKEQYTNINEDRIIFISDKKNQYLEKILSLEQIKEEI